MSVFRFPVLLMLGVLSACDSADTPAPTPPRAPTVQEGEAAMPSGVEPATAPSAPAATDAQAPKAPLAEPPAVEPVGEFKPELQLPAPKAEPPLAVPAAVETPRRTPPAKKQLAAPRQPSKAVPMEQAALPAAPLDLSLPKGLLNSLQPPDDQAPIDRKLLPPLFEDKPTQDPFQLNGRLLTRDREDEIEGAELQFEFKR